MSEYVCGCAFAARYLSAGSANATVGAVRGFYMTVLLQILQHLTRNSLGWNIFFFQKNVDFQPISHFIMTQLLFSYKDYFSEIRHRVPSPKSH